MNLGIYFFLELRVIIGERKPVLKIRACPTYVLASVKIISRCLKILQVKLFVQSKYIRELNFDYVLSKTSTMLMIRS